MSNLREIYNFDSDLSTLSYSLIQYLFILIIYTREIIFSIVKYPIKKCFHRKYLKKLHLIIYIDVQGKKENFWKWLFVIGRVQPMRLNGAEGRSIDMITGGLTIDVLKRLQKILF